MYFFRAASPHLILLCSAQVHLCRPKGSPELIFNPNFSIRYADTLDLQLAYLLAISQLRRVYPITLKNGHQAS